MKLLEEIESIYGSDFKNEIQSISERRPYRISDLWKAYKQVGDLKMVQKIFDESYSRDVDPFDVLHIMKKSDFTPIILDSCHQ